MGYAEIVSQFRDKKILVIGDVMLDRFIWGEVGRISPEAPVPVVEVERELFFPGGAANAARNLVAFTGGASIMGLIGEDWAGKELEEILHNHHLDTRGLVRRSDYTTIIKTRILARSQQLLRIDREKRRPLGPQGVAEALQFIDVHGGELDAIIVEDYGKGFVGAELLQGLVKLKKKHGFLLTADPNPNNPLPWSGLDAIKPNRKEAFQEAGIIDHHPHGNPLEDTDLLRVGEILLDKWQAQDVLITLGEQGMLLFERDGEPYHSPTKAREVFDVSGAGDTAIALYTLALCAGATTREAAEISNHASGVVVGKIGTATLEPQELIDSFQSNGHHDG